MGDVPVHSESQRRKAHSKENPAEAGDLNSSSFQGLLPVGKGHAACGLSDVLAGTADVVAMTLFFSGCFLAATFFAGACLVAVFPVAAFFTGAVLLGAFFNEEVFATTFFAGAFLVATFFIGAFLAPASFRRASFGADAFLTGAFFAGIFFAGTFFAVAISFSLIKVQRKLSVVGFLPLHDSYSSPKVCPGGALRYDESGSGSSVPSSFWYISIRKS